MDVCGQEYDSEELAGPLNETERKYAPDRLYASGDTSLLSEEYARVSVVGTRQPSDLGIGRASRLARELVTEGVVVVSGLAKGIDTAAHVSAMRHGGRTVAVLGTSLSRAYPVENQGLQEEIARDHLLVSQFGPQDVIGRWSFPARNRTMALLSHATVIVEAGVRSGCVSQGWEALRLGRELFLLKSLVDRADLDWPKQLLSYGARVLQETPELIEALPAAGARLDAF